jgi:hypothetical protein
MSNRPTAEDAAREIIRIAVRDLHLKPNDAIDAPPVIERFNNLPWKQTDLRPGLILAQEKGWVTIEGRLTAAGFAAAPI